MNHLTFTGLFLFVPLVVIAAIFIKIKWNSISVEEEDLVTVRQGNPIEFDESQFLKSREMTVQGKSECQQPKEIQMQEKISADLTAKLTE